jgi:hypothetical protein
LSAPLPYAFATGDENHPPVTIILPNSVLRSKVHIKKDLGKSHPLDRFGVDELAQLRNTRHSTFLHAIACTFSATVHHLIFKKLSQHLPLVPLPRLTTLLTTTNTMSLLPPPEAVYPDPTTAFNAIQLHAKDHGYRIN